MDSFNFTALILHPNTETVLIENRNLLLKNEFKNFIPLFPLYGIFTDQKFSSELKNFFSETSKCVLKGFSCINSILYCHGAVESENSSTPFIIPCAIEKKTDSKDLLSVYKSGLIGLKVLNPAQIKLFSSEISFKSFQIADCRLSKNQYSIYESFWIKSIT